MWVGCLVDWLVYYDGIGVIGECLGNVYSVFLVIVYWVIWVDVGVDDGEIWFGSCVDWCGFLVGGDDVVDVGCLGG